MMKPMSLRALFVIASICSEKMTVEEYIGPRSLIVSLVDIGWLKK